ncbi:hypothetical protein L0244_24225, partial [bacterium]|nr:hypothetical protein [bacterium]
SESKQKQLSRNTQVTKKDLTDVAGIPVKCTTYFDIPYIVNPIAAPYYNKYFDDNKITFPLLTFEIGETKYKLFRVKGTFSEPKTDAIFSNINEFDRIPTSYLPISLEEISISNLVSLVCQELISLIVKNKKRFTLSFFCEDSIPAWSLIDIRKQGEIKDRVRDILRSLMQVKWLFQILTKDPNARDEFEIPDFAAVKPRMRSFRTLINEFIKEQKKEPHQGQLDI